jgi:6-phosphogluconolactonase (cycloisomerase 2 family)
VTAGSASAAPLTPGAVFTETNSLANAVLAFNRGADGKLTPAGQYPTGGSGQQPTNPPAGFPVLDSAGPVELSSDGDNRSCLFAVNAGSSTVSSFRVGPKGLELADVANSGGQRPVSVTSTPRGPGKQVMYVLNSDVGAASIQGYYVSSDCTLAAIPGSNRPTSSPQSLPASIRFDRHGRALAVSERFAPVYPAGSGDIDIFPVDAKGVAQAPVVTPSPEPTPYGLDWNRHDVLSVTNEHFQGLILPTVFSSTVSTYALNPDYTLTPIDTKPSPGAACWNLFTNDNRFLYTSNPVGTFPAGGTGGTEDAFRVAPDGTMTPLASYNTTYQAIDNALSHDSQFLYVLSDQIAPPFPPVSAIDEYAIDPSSGLLTPIGTVNLPGNNTSGLAAW